jgi:hypothetical protein
MPRAPFALLLALAVSAAMAGPIDKTGKRPADSDGRKAIGDFGAQLVFVADDDAMLNAWHAQAETVNVSTVDKAVVGDQVNAFIVFSGCKPDSAGHCDVTVRFRVYQPDGKEYASTPPMEVWQFKKAPTGRMLEIGVQYLKVAIEHADPLGKYIVVASVKDHVSGLSLDLSAPFTVVKSK